MYTQCHQCETVFQIGVRELREAHGQVRCGRCGEVFDALGALIDDPPPAGNIPVTVFSDRPPTLHMPEDDETEADLFLGQPPPVIRFDAIEDTELEDFEARPRPLHGATGPLQRRHRRGHGGAWALGSLLLLLLLAVQLAWGERRALLDDPTLRPWLDRACLELGCRLPLRRDIEQVRLISRDIRPHPSVEGALIINATLRNEADFTQPYPDVEIRLADLEGDPVAARRFDPDEYLDDDTAVDKGMAAGTLLPLVFEVVDPGDNAVAFEFVFR